MSRAPSTLRITLLYTSFAVVATAVNLGAQRGVLWLIDPPLGLWAALVVGTGAGLVVKYALDKRYIFGDRTSGLRGHAQRFSRYSLMGVGTTLLFWTIELSAWYLYQTDMAREIGAVIGLAIGYFVKYQLDKRFVFKPAWDEAETRGEPASSAP